MTFDFFASQEAAQRRFRWLVLGLSGAGLGTALLLHVATSACLGVADWLMLRQRYLRDASVIQASVDAKRTTLLAVEAQRLRETGKAPTLEAAEAQARVLYERLAAVARAEGRGVRLQAAALEAGADHRRLDLLVREEEELAAQREADRKRSRGTWFRDRVASPDLAIGWLLFTAIVAIVGAVYRSRQLEGAGSLLASYLRGRPISVGTRDLHERRLLNVVEEMALAAGCAVPAVWVLPQESGINVLTVGAHASDTVICVTRGAMVYLSRDELQAVIGHELSHLHNGDVQLNHRLVGAAFGIQLLVVGAVFLAFIKAALSRERELRADAAAVQFTRNPQALAKALRKIGGCPHGSIVRARHADEVSHMFFARGTVRDAGFQVLATHPPLPARIRAIDPTWDGSMIALGPIDQAATDAVAPDAHPPGLRKTRATAIPIAAALASVGQPAASHLRYAEDLHARLPPDLALALRDAFSSRALVFALLLDRDAEVRRRQLDRLGAKLGAPTRRAAEGYHATLGQVGPEARLPLVELAMPALRELSADQYEAVQAMATDLALADGRHDVFELAVLQVLRHHLGRRGARPARQDAILAIGGLRPEISWLLSALARSGGAAHAELAYGAGLAQLKLDDMAPLAPHDPNATERAGDALDKLAAAAPQIKRRVLGAAASCIEHDGVITVAEGELLRAIALAFDCPMPPLVAEAVA